MEKEYPNKRFIKKKKEKTSNFKGKSILQRSVTVVVPSQHVKFGDCSF